MTSKLTGFSTIFHSFIGWVVVLLTEVVEVSRALLLEFLLSCGRQCEDLSVNQVDLPKRTQFS